MDELFLDTRPLIIGHRGSSCDFPENTLPAFENIGGEADGVETDVQLTKDEVPVLYHDRTLKKITGSGEKICSLTLSDLNKLDFGSWFSPNFKGTGIVSLNDFLLKYRQGKKLFIEIKARYDDPPQTCRILTEQVVSLVIKNSLKKSVALLSFNPDALRYGYALCNKIACLQVFEKQAPVLEASLKDAPWLKGYVVALNLLSQKFVEAAHKRGKVVGVFTCNTEEELSTATNLGVDAIFSDNPKAASTWMKKTF